MQKTFLITICVLLQVSFLYAQTKGYTYQVIGTRDGLQSSKIFSLHQGADRRLWLGTELGISIYNGYDFTNIQYSADKKQLGRILAITSDNFGGTWLGGDKGLFYVSRNGIKKISVRERNSIAIEALITDNAGNILVAELNGLYRIATSQIKTFSETSAAILPNGYYKNFNKRAFSLHSDKYGNLYTGGFEGVHILNKDSKEAKIIWKNPNPGNEVRSVAALSPDSIYWNSYDSEPMKLINGKLETMQHPAFTGRTVFIHKNKPYALTTSGIADIAGATIQPIVSFDNLSNLVYDALIDAEDNIWLGSWEGLIKYRRTAFKKYTLQHPLNTDAFSFLERSNGEVLIGGNRGRLFIKQGDVIVPHPTLPRMFNKAEIMTMYEHQDGSLWFGSGYQGITRYKNNSIRNWDGRSGSLQNNNCELILNAGNNKLFACTEKGVTIIDPAKENAIQGYYNYKKEYTLYPELFGGIQVGANWLFYGSQGTYKLNNGFLEDDSIAGTTFSSLYIHKIVKDVNDHYWVATLGHGLLKCSLIDSRLVLQKKFDEHSGMPSNDILSVLIDKNNHVWSADYMSMSVLIHDNITDRIISFNEKDGLLNSYYQTLKLEQQNNGTIWGITSMGVISFHPDSLRLNSLAPDLVLNHVAVNPNDTSKTFLVTGDALVKSNLFSYKENSIQFNFTGTSLTDPTKVRYAYRIRELDSSWTITDERSISYNFLQPGDYVFEIKASNNNNVWTREARQFSFTILPPFWKTWWFRSFAFLFAAVLIFIAFKNRLNRVQEKAAIRQQLAELEGKALRAQMNPHFIFNSLNAIQECIVMSKIDSAYEYLARFSKLLRMVLNNSEQSFISLQEELEMIKLYLELESLRFKNSFEYSLDIDKNIDLEMAEVPPLLLQPFIENAIWHGLRNKEGEKKLMISCRVDNSGITCTIQDNGIGREKAREIKAGKMGSSNFESKGMLLSEQRIHIMNLEHSEKFDIKVFDLYDSGIACGTKVIVQLPQILN